MGPRVGVLRLPQAFDRVGIEEFAELLHEVSTRAVIVVRADLGPFRDPAQPQSDRALSPMMRRVLSRFLALERPTVGLVDRTIDGLSVGIIACCDAVVATTRGSFGLRQPGQSQIAPEIWPILAARVPIATLRTWGAASDAVSTQAALAGGLVDIECPPEAADETLRAEVRTLCSVVDLCPANFAAGLVEASTLERPSARRRRGWRR